MLSLLTAAMFVSVAGVSICGAAPYDPYDEGDEYYGVELAGNIDVKIDGFIGVVSPIINITEEQENQSVTFLVNATEDPEDPANNSYIVEDTITIDLEITDNSGRDSFVISRFVIYHVMITRPIGKALPGGLGIINRLFPVRKLGRVHVVNSLFGGNISENISIDFSYKLRNKELFDSGENLTLHITVIGFLPGNSNGISDMLPIVDHKAISLDVKYAAK